MADRGPRQAGPSLPKFLFSGYDKLLHHRSYFDGVNSGLVGYACGLQCLLTVASRSLSIWYPQMTHAAFHLG